MTLRYLISFPNDVSPYFIDQLRDQLAAIADDKAERDLIVSMGATITDLREPKPKRPAIVRRARALHR